MIINFLFATASWSHLIACMCLTMCKLIIQFFFLTLYLVKHQIKNHQWIMIHKHLGLVLRYPLTFILSHSFSVQSLSSFDENQLFGLWLNWSLNCNTMPRRHNKLTIMSTTSINRCANSQKRLKKTTATITKTRDIQ